MIKLTIYGRLRKFIGQSTFNIKANSAKEAFSFLINNFQLLVFGFRFSLFNFNFYGILC